MDDQLRRLKRFLIISWFLTLLLLVGLAFAFFSYDAKRFKDQVLALENRQVKVIAAQDGHDGYTPIKGVDYFDGIDGSNGGNGANAVSTIQVQPVYTNIPVPGPVGATGAKGSKGDKGDLGKAVFVDTVNNLCRYAGDLVWQPILECQ
jgi:hypothetical protein